MGTKERAASASTIVCNQQDFLNGQQLNVSMLDRTTQKQARGSKVAKNENHECYRFLKGLQIQKFNVVHNISSNIRLLKNRVASTYLDKVENS